uniref:RanBD1 domain-containing protein n=1 Tax=Timema genevievae TaxID=629358 RepID=A0A7R9JR55_TIMGE|nr:unnamed protein product [Timema genevievae]
MLANTIKSHTNKSLPAKSLQESKSLPSRSLQESKSLPSKAFKNIRAYRPRAIKVTRDYHPGAFKRVRAHRPRAFKRARAHRLRAFKRKFERSLKSKMAKRIATSELNHDNWNQEEKSEEAGSFKKAAPEVMQQRIIKAAKRRAGHISEELPEKIVSSPKKLANFISSQDKQSSVDSVSTSLDRNPPNKRRKSDQYYLMLQGLNDSVSRWVKQHVDINPHCILTPVFDDYSKHLEELEQKYGNIHDKDEPPKPSHTPVVEEGAIYSKRCKMFVKKGGPYQELGVGTLFLKPVSGGDKTQLIVRADTSLGNVLLNTLLSSSLPVQRMGKNNVMIVCLPTPDATPPPVPVLLRVKTGEEADELLDKLNQHRK